MQPISVITVLGAGYVGLTTATLFAHAGYKVYAIEPNPKRLEAIKTGRSFFFEAGIDPLIAEALRKGTLIATDSYEESVPNSQVVFSCVGTPDNPDGSSNLSYVFGAAEQAATLMKNGTMFVQKSTVPVGTGDKLAAVFQAAGKTIPYVSNPEFLRESTAIADTLWFDRVVVGGNNSSAIETVTSLYKDLEKNRGEIAKIAGLSQPANYTNGEYISTGQNSAELIKVTSNAFLALKISFANSIAKLADAAGANITEVMDAVGADKRIGRAFLNAGRGYGGGCFPKDVSGLIASAGSYGVDMHIMREASNVNASMPGYIVQKIEALYGAKDFAGKKASVLGLAFKSGTSDTRRSPAIDIANTLVRFGCSVAAYDPEANEEAKADGLDTAVSLNETTDECVAGADIVIIATGWSEFKSYDLNKMKKAMNGDIFVDTMNTFDAATVKNAGFRYLGVGQS